MKRFQVRSPEHRTRIDEHRANIAHDFDRNAPTIVCSASKPKAHCIGEDRIFGGKGNMIRNRPVIVGDLHPSGKSRSIAAGGEAVGDRVVSG